MELPKKSVIVKSVVKKRRFKENTMKLENIGDLEYVRNQERSVSQRSVI